MGGEWRKYVTVSVSIGIFVKTEKMESIVMTKNIRRMTDKVQKIREKVEKLKSNLIHGACASQVAMETRCKEEAYDEVLAILDSMQEEPVSGGLEEVSKNYALNNTPWDDCKDEMQEAFEAGTQWLKSNLWKPSDGDDLPEIDREVIALVQDYPDDKDHLRVVFTHRPNKYAKVWNYDLGEEQVVEIEGYDKGGWNIPNVKYWLDCYLPKEIEEL